MVSRWKKTAALAVSALCATINLTTAFQFFSLWRASKRDTATESEGLTGGWARGMSTLGGLATLYFLVATVANVIGVVGIVKRYPRCVRFWRDFSIADFACTTTTTVFAVYASSRYYDLRNSLCEELSRHDDVMMDLSEMGITLENCEQWSQRAVFAFVVLLVIIHLVRLHLVITVSKIFSRHHGHGRRASSMHRIYILPSMPGAPTEVLEQSNEESAASIPDVVYAPIPLNQLSPRDVRALSPHEAWISCSPAGTRQPRTHSHDDSTGRIGLPISPGEALFPSPREK